MKNLVLLGESRRKLNPPPTEADVDADIVSLCRVLPHNFESESSTVVLTENGILTKVTDDGSVLWKCNLEEVEDAVGGGWFDVSFIDPELVCLSRLGAIVTVDPTTGTAELVGIFDQGLEAAAWSPDKEILLMVTSIVEDDDDDDEGKHENNNDPPEINAHLMTMNASFEVLAEVRIPKYVPSSASKESKISVTWRPDGSLCAVSSVDAEDSMRNVRIYKRETLEVHAIGRSEDASGTLVKNLQNAEISWAGTGCSQLLASVQRKGKKTHQVVFFESNGLRHREFLLREAPSTVVTSLNWNATSDILAVSLREDDGTDKIQLWHRCNYHWYLKHELRYQNRKVQHVQFSRENQHELLVLLSGFEWRDYEVRWDPSTILSFEEKSLAFVIDGSSLNLTAFQKALIPPPMCANSCGMAFPINGITFCKASHYLGASLIHISNGSLVLLQYKMGSASSYNQTEVLWGDTKDIDPFSLRSFLIVGAEQDKLHVVALQCAPCNEVKDRIIEITISNLDNQEPRSDVVGMHELEGQLKRAIQWSDKVDGCLLQLSEGALFEYERSETSSILPSEAEPLMEVCPWMSAIKDVAPYSDSSHSDFTGTRLVFGLSSKSRLYQNDMMLADSASSFFLSLNHEFLCYVTTGSRCQTRFLPLKEIHAFDPLMGLEQNYLLEGYEPRNVEQGSRVVAILPQRPQMILQMPRGNLESIYPRALVLRYLMSRITAGVYDEAFRMMRKHKVDLNLIVDLDPKDFLDNGISFFVKQVDVIDYLNLFISTLQNYDVTSDRFPIPTWFQDKTERSNQTFDFSTKVNQICRKARSIMLDFERQGDKPSRYYLLPVLSTFAKENPPKLDEALNLIKDDALKANSVKVSKNPLFSENAQSSIKYLAFLAEYELLFETALGMYDFEIARAVARNSQMDPKIYLPLLKRFNGLPTYFSRYEVDVRLKRFDMALKNLYESNARNEDLDSYPQFQISNGNSFEDCMNLINEHKIHKLGLDLFRADTEKSKKVLTALGNSLMEQRRPSTALTVFLSTEPPDIEGAMRASRSARDWRCYFSLLETGDNDDEPTNQVEFRLEKRRQAAREIADDIVASGFGSKSKRQASMDASQLLLDYGDDLIGAVDCLTAAHCWSEAYRIATLHSRKDLMKKCIDSAVAFAHESLGNFEERVEDFEKTNLKYFEVLKLRKQNVYLQGPEAAASDGDETGSLFSVASTISNMSLRSNASTSSSSSIGSNVSSVISIKTANTFSMTGGNSGYRHRSKFNKGKKKKNRSRKKKPRRKPGSVEELQGLVGILKSSCPDSDYGAAITETIQFLMLVQNLLLARELFDAYSRMQECIEKSRLERIEKTTKEKEEASDMTRYHGAEHDLNHILVDLPIEKQVDDMSCAQLVTSLSDFFDFLPN